MAQRDVYLVIGGSGFVGKHIVSALRARGDSVAVFDLVQRSADPAVPFFSGDISEDGAIRNALDKSGATCIIHTASPMHGLKDEALYWRVNVDGTRCVVEAAVASPRVTKLVFTSSASVVFTGTDLVNGDERMPYPPTFLDAYNETKARGEQLVLEANGKGGLLTVALRPAGIFGPGDRQVMTGFAQVYQRRQTHFQLGDGTNLFDWTYVGNVAHAHLLAADKLVAPGEKQPDADALLNYHLPAVSLTTGARRVPTSAARPLGPFVTPPPNADALLAAYETPLDPRADARPVYRSKFDPLSDRARALADPGAPEPLQVAGNAFFVTNGEPIYFWDMARAIWAALAAADPASAPPPRGTWKLSRTLGMMLATGAEAAGWLTGREPTFTRFRVAFACAQRWHNIEKARRVLGYEPIIGMDEGIKRMVEWWVEQERAKAQ